jgi:AcrR family transcriptional regulator
MSATPTSTKERILDVALELFNEQGYDKTSLRQIAERLGVTKAALYYHFERKEDIFLELHLRLHRLGRGILDELDGLGPEEIVAAWPHVLDAFVDEVLANRDLFLLHQRNENAFKQIIDDERHRAENEDIEERFRALLADSRIPLEERVRMASSIGAIFVPLMGTGDMFGDAAPDEVAGFAREAVRDLLRRSPQ